MNDAFTLRFDIEIYRFVNHCPFFETIGVTCVLMVFCTFGTIVSLIVVHFRAAFTMGKGVGVTFSSSWGRSSIGE